MKSRWTQAKLQKPRITLPWVQGQLQDLPEPPWDCSGRLPWQVCPAALCWSTAISFWPLLSNSHQLPVLLAVLMYSSRCCFNYAFLCNSLRCLSDLAEKEDFSILKELCLFSVIGAGHVTHYDRLTDKFNTLLTNCSWSCFIPIYLLLGRVRPIIFVILFDPWIIHKMIIATIQVLNQSWI